MGNEKQYTLAPLPEYPWGGRIAPGDIVRVRFQVLDNNTCLQPDKPVKVTLQLSDSGPGATVVGDSCAPAAWYQALQLDTRPENGLVQFYIKAGKTAGPVRGYASIQGLSDIQHWVSLSHGLVIQDIASLKIVSGGRQFRTLDGAEFDELVVQALDIRGGGVNQATVRFTSPTLPAGTELSANLVQTDSAGMACVKLIKGITPGMFQVQASTSVLSSALFCLALGPQSTDLELEVKPRDFSLHLRDELNGACKAHVYTKGTKVGWPYIHGTAEALSDGIQLNPGERKAINLVSDESGSLRPVEGHEVEILPKKAGRATVRFEAFVLSAHIFRQDINVTVIAK